MCNFYCCLTFHVCCLSPCIKQSVNQSSIGSVQAWSIMYLSWLTFLLLLTACFLWMMPNSRRASIAASPLLVLYLYCYLITQYIWNIELDHELPVFAGSVAVSEIGLVHFNTPPKDFAIEVSLACDLVCNIVALIRYSDGIDVRLEYNGCLALCTLLHLVG